MIYLYCSEDLVGTEITTSIVINKQLQAVTEALYILCAACSVDSEGDKLYLNTKYLYLTNEEQMNPYLVLKEFRKDIPYTHVHAEIWDIMTAVVGFKGNMSISKIRLMHYFEMFLCIVKAPYLLTEEDPELLAQIKNVKIKE